VVQYYAVYAVVAASISGWQVDPAVVVQSIMLLYVCKLQRSVSSSPA
jgi:hypothetical protein